MQASIAAQDFVVVGTTSESGIQLPVDQKAHISIPLQTTVSSSWSLVIGKLERLFGSDPKTFKANQSSSTRPVKISLHGSTSDKQVEAQPSQEYLQPLAQRAQSSSRSNADLLPNLIPRSQRYGPSFLAAD